ncbi:ABC transporter substrate-binding protein [Alicycliphilus denitrificans]|uniref:Bug family tripartite tricarboxylate transporter substrate binding protein n=1 Tax=Alicycliphilus denitrificans TaxID=179636 RepID=UPI000961F815|nr:tripartite tricarboxylate transporter substrate binding protein [Alicycliphilus denitrificans]MBN9575306.1 tripartite tricarboxylate transporter substrate binding protein [Alicycliphilus denitrificans]OJW93084.1 MAG: ABC transporter substrate-binding protein [Alicycliphilus sp. 69-12]BCN37081.1 ABC transporter substrate-binding protein [Alicycliphilus denitrificans]
MKRRALCGALVMGAVALASPLAGAAGYPERPVKVIVSLPPGSGADTTARFLAQHLTQQLGQPFVVENKPGANSFIAARAVAEAVPDGYTMFVASNTPMVTNAAIFKKLPYDPIHDFTPVASIGRFPMIVVVPANSPYKTLPALVAAMKEAPAKLNFASGTPSYQIAMEQLHEMNGVKGTVVNYKGTGPAITDLAAGVCDYSIAEVSSVLPLIQGGKLRALAVADSQRHRDLPDVPTAAEVGNKGYEAYAWTGVYFPAKVPKEIAQRVGDIVRTTLNGPEGTAFITKMGGTVFTGTAQQFADFQYAEIEKTKRIVKVANIPVE